MAQVKILFLSKHIPYRADSGVTVKMRNLLTCLSGEFAVTCAFIVEERESNRPDLDACRLHVTNYLIESKRESSSLKRYLLHLLELFVISEKIKISLSEIMEKEKPDLVWLEFGYIGNYIPFLKRFGVPVIYGSHNSQFKLDFGIWKANGNIQYRLRMAPFVLLYFIHERLYFKQADLMLCISTQDIPYYARFIKPTKLRLLPFLFDCGGIAAIAPLPSDHPYVCLIGSLRAYQNFSAAKYAIEEVFPLLSEKNSRLLLYIIGELPDENSPEYRLLSQNSTETGRVILTGRVESVIPFVKGATAHLVPLSIGSGVRTKIIESVVCGTPVVSTSIGAEGLPFIDGESIFIADTAEDLAEKVLLLVNDDKLRKEMSEKAFAKYREELSCEVGIKMIRKYLRDL
jgi:glycosyltransferase involved in cell wall biosynthesis